MDPHQCFSYTFLHRTFTREGHTREKEQPGCPRARTLGVWAKKVLYKERKSTKEAQGGQEMLAVNMRMHFLLPKKCGMVLPALQMSLASPFPKQKAANKEKGNFLVLFWSLFLKCRKQSPLRTSEKMILAANKGRMGSGRQQLRFLFGKKGQESSAAARSVLIKHSTRPRGNIY